MSDGLASYLDRKMHFRFSLHYLCLCQSKVFHPHDNFVTHMRVPSGDFVLFGVHYFRIT